MTELVKIDLEAETISQDIETTMENIQAGHVLFVTSFARLGFLLCQVRKHQYWEEWGYESFGAYIKEIETKIKKGRSQIYNSISVAERLLPYASEEQIEKMGISKATELAKMIKLAGPPSPAAVNMAENPLIEVDELKAYLHEKNKVQKLDDKGKFYDLKGFFVTEEERAELDFVFELATKVDPPIPQETSEWERRKQVMFRLIAEFRAQYEEEVYGKHS